MCVNICFLKGTIGLSCMYERQSSCTNDEIIADFRVSVKDKVFVMFFEISRLILRLLLYRKINKC
jgi:hypothetical protein